MAANDEFRSTFSTTTRGMKEIVHDVQLRQSYVKDGHGTISFLRMEFPLPPDSHPFDFGYCPERVVYLVTGLFFCFCFLFVLIFLLLVLLLLNTFCFLFSLPLLLFLLILSLSLLCSCMPRIPMRSKSARRNITIMGNETCQVFFR